MHTDATTPTIYLDAKRLNLNTDYKLSGEVTDGITTTPSNTITFKTPTGVGLEELILKDY